MRWPIIRVIWARELRDQLRDRRTMFMILVLPLLIYPLAGFALTQLAISAAPGRNVVGFVGAEHLPQADNAALRSAAASLSGGSLLSALTLSAAASLPPFPPLLIRTPQGILFAPTSREPDPDRLLTEVILVDAGRIREGLKSGSVDVVVVVPPDFRQRLEGGDTPPILVLFRSGDDASRAVLQKVLRLLDRWKERLREVRFQRYGLPARFDAPFEVKDVDRGRPSIMQLTEDIFDLLVRVFPFVIVLWSLAGALYPAVDLCAGEKERGTMETLLISPAQREEIVWGKFLAIWVFSGVTALLNLASMAATSWHFSMKLVHQSIPVLSYGWCVVLLLPLSAFFSAVTLSVGAYAGSTKEGQYYLMPLFLVAMPLTFLTMVPGVELNPFYSMVPVTGVALLMQRLMLAPGPDPTLWLYFVPVLASMVIYSWLALRWAIIQFQREEVLFREAERLDFRLWLGRLFRDKEPRPSAGQAVFCFVVVLGLSWFSIGLGGATVMANVIRVVAFVAAPTLLMALLLTTQPRQSLALRLPSAWWWPFTLALAAVLTPTLIELTRLVSQLNPNLRQLTEQFRPSTAWLQSLAGGEGKPAWQTLLVFAVLPALCEELTFRGFILTGLQRRFRPRTAVLLSGFLFALLQMNVFRFVPAFLLGVVLAYLTTRCGSVLPAMLFRVIYDTLPLVPGLLYVSRTGTVDFGLAPDAHTILAAVCAVASAGLLWRLTKHRPHPAYVAFLHSDPGLEAAR